MRQTLWVGFGSCVKATVRHFPVQPLATLVSRGICCRIWPHFWWRWWGRPPNSLRLVVGLASLVWLFGKRSFLWEHWKFSPDKRRISVGFLLACVQGWLDRPQWACHLRPWQVPFLTEVWSWSMFSVQQLTLNDGLLKLTSLQPHHVDKVQIGKCRCVVPVIRDSAYVNYWDEFKCRDGVLAVFTSKLRNGLSVTFVLARICCANCATAFCWVGSKMTFCCWMTLLRTMPEPSAWGLPLLLSAILFV